MGEMESFALNLLHSASCAHVYHWQTTSYSAHKALGKFYGTMPDLVDGLVETYMGRNGIFGEVDKEQEVYMDKDPLAYMRPCGAMWMTPARTYHRIQRSRT